MVHLKKNETYSIEITGMNHEGQGVGRIENFAVFVDGLMTGETAEIKIIKVTSSYAVGKLQRILRPSPARVRPFCSTFKRCGGCALQHMDYKAQLEFKTGLIKDSIKRIGKLEDVQIRNTIGMKRPLKYRNKAQYPVGAVEDGIKAGFYASRSHEIIENEACSIQDEVSDRVKAIVKEFAVKNGISAYDEATGKGILRHVMTRVAFKTGEVMVVLVINGIDLHKKQELIKVLTMDLGLFEGSMPAPKVVSIVLNINNKKTNVVLGDKNVTIFGSDTITDYIGEFKFEISPLSFFQVNPLQTEVLYRKALNYAGLTGNETVFDLYCGIGTISLFLSQNAAKVYGIEVVEDAVKDAQRNARLNGIENVEFIAGQAESVVPEMYKKGIKADVVVVDPPRKGCDEALLKTLVEMQPQRIVYVSCNPSTLARDLNYLAGNGFKAVEVQGVDMFPHTAHVECVALIERIGQ